MSNNKHIEAAAAAIYADLRAAGTPHSMARCQRAAQVAWDAIVASLASAGENALHAAARDAYVRATVNGGDFDAGLRAAVAVARASMGEVVRDAERWRWLSTHPEHPLFPTFSMSFDTLDEACDAAREKEAASYE